MEKSTKIWLGVGIGVTVLGVTLYLTRNKWLPLFSGKSEKEKSDTSAISADTSIKYVRPTFARKGMAKAAIARGVAQSGLDAIEAEKRNKKIAETGIVSSDDKKAIAVLTQRGYIFKDNQLIKA